MNGALVSNFYGSTNFFPLRNHLDVDLDFIQSRQHSAIRRGSHYLNVVINKGQQKIPDSFHVVLDISRDYIMLNGGGELECLRISCVALPLIILKGIVWGILQDLLREANDAFTIKTE